MRQPIVVVLGHVDSGKTTLLDKIRGTALQLREAGGMISGIA
ncbi:MAG: GTP-binding protein [Thermoprotei archaeon]|jgi:translation initiation factor 5B